MNLFLDYTDKQLSNTKIIISGSKSESNRLLVLQKIYPNLELKNLSDSDDTIHLQEALTSNNDIINIGHAGTAMRFLTSYFSVKEGKEIILTGSERMQNRPIKILVEALKTIGADILYMDKDGYPPLKIKGKKLIINKVSIDGNVSSQYISALLLIASSLKNGLEIELLGEVTSIPYIKMTLTILNDLGIKTTWKENIIIIEPKRIIEPKTVIVESDWSSASYFYSLVALSEIGATITLSSYKKESLQGDNSLVNIYKNFGVETKFNQRSITLSKETTIISSAFEKSQPLTLNLQNTPDLAQTIAVTCFGLGIACDLTGLHTLKIKETDRLVALKNELEKLGVDIEITDKSLHLKISNIINRDITIQTYDDHRMAMAFAPLALKASMIIENADVVTKSYVKFWKDLERAFV